MSKQPPLKGKKHARPKRRRFTEEFKAEAVQMLLDGHSASSLCERLGLSSPNLLSRWKREAIRQGGPVATGLDGRIRELEAELRRVERERDILTGQIARSRSTVLCIFGRDG